MHDSLQPLSDSLAGIDLTGHPPLEQWHPVYEGEIDIVIKADGTWLHEGRGFQRTRLVQLFASILWFENGQHYLKTPAEKMQITVEDAAFFIPTLTVLAAGTAQQQLVFTSSYGDRVLAGVDHPLWVEEAEATGEPRPYLGMRYGMRAKLSRSVFYQLAELATLSVGAAAASDSTSNDDVPTAETAGDALNKECWVVHSAGQAFVLGEAE